MDGSVDIIYNIYVVIVFLQKNDRSKENTSTSQGNEGCIGQDGVQDDGFLRRACWRKRSRKRLSIRGRWDESGLSYDHARGDQKASRPF